MKAATVARLVSAATRQRTEEDPRDQEAGWAAMRHEREAFLAPDELSEQRRYEITGWDEA